MQKDYLDFKLGLIEKTFELYVQRMDIWENQFYQIKYGCITIVTALLGFRYTTQADVALNYIALATTVGFWVFEATLRTTFARYVAKLDILTEIINNKTVMEEAIKTRQLDAARVLDFDIRMRTLREPISEFVKIKFSDKSDEETQEIIEEIITQKRGLASIWNSFKLKNVVVFYVTLILLQLLALFFFKP